MTQATKHTPTPWHIRNADTDSPVLAFSDGEIVSYVLHNAMIAEEHGGTALENARHIVRCVNAHDELVAALRCIDAALNQNKTYPADVELARKQCAATLAKIS